MSKLAVAYLRVSTATNQDGHGFERQAHTVREFCLKQGFPFAGEFGRYGQAVIRNDQFSVSSDKPSGELG